MSAIFYDSWCVHWNRNGLTTDKKSEADGFKEERDRAKNKIKREAHNCSSLYVVYVQGDKTELTKETKSTEKITEEATAEARPFEMLGAGGNIKEVEELDAGNNPLKKTKKNAKGINRQSQQDSTQIDIKKTLLEDTTYTVINVPIAITSGEELTMDCATEIQMTTTGKSNYQYTITYQLLRDKTIIAKSTIEKKEASEEGGICIRRKIPQITWVDSPPAGEYNYSVNIGLSGVNISNIEAHSKLLSTVSPNKK